MESNLVNKKTDNKTLLTFALIACSMLSCCSRADYNILIGFFILLIRGYNSEENAKKLTKIGIQLLCITLIFDLIWFFRYTGIWQHGEETSELWKSLSSIHNLAYFLGIIEFLLKLPIGFLIYKQYINALGGQNKDLLNIKYSQAKN